MIRCERPEDAAALRRVLVMLEKLAARDVDPEGGIRVGIRVAASEAAGDLRAIVPAEVLDDADPARSLSHASRPAVIMVEALVSAWLADGKAWADLLRAALDAARDPSPPVVKAALDAEYEQTGDTRAVSPFADAIGYPEEG